MPQEIDKHPLYPAHGNSQRVWDNDATASQATHEAEVQVLRAELVRARAWAVAWKLAASEYRNLWMRVVY